MKENIYRKKSLDKISSPEDLNSFMTVANPPVWLALIAIALILIGGICWGIFGHLDTTVPALVVSNGNEVICYIGEDEISSVKEGMEVRCDNQTSSVTEIGEPVLASSVMSAYAQHIGAFEDGEYVYPVTLPISLEEGTYESKIVVESVSAASFLWN